LGNERLKRFTVFQSQSLAWGECRRGFAMLFKPAREGGIALILGGGSNRENTNIPQNGHDGECGYDTDKSFGEPVAF
jgi:hypothetical protein